MSLAPLPPKANALTAGPSISSIQDVAQMLDIPLKTLTYWCFAAPDEKKYTAFNITRRSGGVRRIEAPIKPLKDIQRRFLDELADLYRPPKHVHGYVHDRSIITNANRHTRQRWVLRVDLADFFPSIHYGRVVGLFKARPFGFPLPVARLLASLCCFQGRIPHGAPTSPYISNLVCRGLDRDLANLARENRCFYTRYADDLIFSTRSQSFPAALAVSDPLTGRATASGTLHNIIRSHSFEINDQKTSLRRRDQRQLVTGLVANEFPNVPRDYVRAVRNILHIWRRYGESEARERFVNTRNRSPVKSTPEFRAIVRGQVQYIGSVKGWHSSVYKNLARSLASVNASFKATSRISKTPPVRLHIACEGKSDYQHMRAAVRHFRSRGELIEIEFDFDSLGMGDAKLLQRCDALSSTHQGLPFVAIFDRDNESIIGKVDDSMGFKSWGGNVYSLAIPVPGHRPPNSYVCIELLYRDQELQRTDSSGRRVYTAAEFDPTTGRHSTEAAYCLYPSRPTLIPETVINFDMNMNVALSKAAFSEAVFKRRPPFDTVDFSGFWPLFEVLKKIRHHILSE